MEGSGADASSAVDPQAWHKPPTAELGRFGRRPGPPRLPPGTSRTSRPLHAVPMTSGSTVSPSTAEIGAAGSSRALVPVTTAVTQVDYDQAFLRSPVSVLLARDVAAQSQQGVFLPELAVVHRAYQSLCHRMQENVGSNYRSANIRGEALLAEMNKQLKLSGVERGSLTDVSIRAATAAWVLNEMAVAPGGEVLRAVRDSLFPYIFADFYDESFFRPIHAADSVLNTRKRQAGVSDEGVLQANPFLGFDFTLDCYRLSTLHAKGLTSALKTMKVFSESTKRLIHGLMRRLNRPLLILPFRAWRTYARNAKIERFREDVLRRRGNRELRHMQLDVAMSRWKLCVEQARNALLLEKVFALEHNVENARTQFNLQCFRSDKYLRTVEELRDDVLRLRLERDSLIDEVDKLKIDIKEFEVRARDQRNADISSVMRELTKWRMFSRRTVIQERRRAADLASSAAADEPSREDADELETLGSTTDVSQEMQLTTEILLKWCNSVIKHSAVADTTNIRRVTNFTNDFQSAELLLLQMHRVSPSTVPLAPLQEPNVARRAELVYAVGKDLGVAYLPTPSEILDGTGDVMMLFTSEMFQRYLANRRVAEDPNDAMTDEPVDATLLEHAAAEVKYDFEMMPTALADASTELLELQTTVSDSIQKDRGTWRAQKSIQHFMAYMSRERLAGRPVTVVDPKDVLRFCRVQKARFVDLAPRYKAPPVDFQGSWMPFDQQLDVLRNALKKNYHELRRVFSYYCAGRAVMSGADFWRFCGDIRIQDRNLTRAQIERIFGIANADEVPMPNAAGQSANDGTHSDDGTSDGGAADDEDEENSVTELIPSEFVECIIRISDAKFGGRTLQDRFQLIMTQCVIPYACKNETDRFLNEVQAPTTQTAVQRYAKDLNKLFNYYAKGGAPAAIAGNRAKRTKTMLLSEFLTFVKDAGLVGGALDESNAASVFNTLSSSAEEVTVKEVNQHEFINAVVCLSAYKVVSPFTALDKKVDVTLSSMIQFLRAKLKGVVTLSDVPVVTLGR